ncbi:MAG: ABC transporter ATP-binding protein [Deltaproteobacteria bacterium]|nr:ABC transporter ATP-binding protein [Deltaproteobacteria bacterium]
MSGLLIEAEGVHKSFPQGRGQLEVLKGIDLRVARGESVAVVGPSGAGKSTLLHLLGALDRPSNGRVLFRGEDVFRRSEPELARFRNGHVGFVFQFHHLLPEFTSLENAAMPARIAGVAPREAEARARELLEAVGLGERLTHRPAELSGGEQQRVALARALVLKPELLLADEPTGNLDHRTGEAIHDILVDLNRRLGTTLVVVTHNLELSRAMGRTVTLIDGRIVGEATERIGA